MDLQKNKYIKWLVYLLVALAYVYLIYKLVTYDDYPALIRHFKNATILQYVYLLLVAVLMPLNIALEACKWKYLLRKVEPTSFQEALNQVLLGWITAFVTPSRVGEHPGRAMRLRNSANYVPAVVLGFIGTTALLIVTIIFGLPASMLFIQSSSVMDNSQWLLWFSAAMFVVLMVLFLFSPALCRRLLRSDTLQDGQRKATIEAVARLTVRECIELSLLSSLRYFTYSIQLYFILQFCGVELSAYQALIAIPTYYMLVSVTPSVPAADAAVRGSWAIFVFQAFSTNTPGMALAAILLWMVNTVLPMFAGKKN